jgi:hypothetical protein
MSDDEQAILEFSRRTMAEISREWGKKINFTTTLDEAAARLTIVATKAPASEIQEVRNANGANITSSTGGAGGGSLIIEAVQEEFEARP